MKPRWLVPFRITQVNYQRNNYTLDLSSNSDLRHIHKTSHIGLLKPHRENHQDQFPQRHYNQSGRVKDDRYEVEKVVNFRSSHAAREPLYQIGWKPNLTSQDQWIHRNKIDEEVKFRFWQEEYLKPTLQRRRYHRGRPERRKRSDTHAEIQGERDRVMTGIIRTTTVQFEEPVADQVLNLFIKG